MILHSNGDEIVDEIKMKHEDDTRLSQNNQFNNVAMKKKKLNEFKLQDHYFF